MSSLLSPGLFAAAALAAQPASPTPVEEVVITVARLPPLVAERAYSTVTLDEAALDDGRRLDEALTDTPGVSLFRRTSSAAANPTTQGLSLRSIAPSGAGRALVTLDGVPLNDPFGGWVVWSQLPSEAVDRVDIVRGGGAGAYGAGALTGAVILRERDAGAVLDVSVAERGGRRAAGWGQVGAGPLRLSVSGLVERLDGYTPVRGPEAGAADQPLDLQAHGAAVRLDGGVGSRGVISLRVSGWEEERGSGLAGGGSRAAGHLVSVTAAAPPGDEALGWRLQAWTHGSDLANRFVAVADDRSSTSPASSQDETPARGWGLNAALRRQQVWADGRLEWELGADARHARGETRERSRYIGGAFTRSRVAGGEALVAGGYVEASWTTGTWLVAGGARLDHWRNSEGRRVERDLTTGAPTLEHTAPDRQGQVASGRAAVRRDLGDWALRAAAYTAFRPPTLNELHRPFRVGNDITEANAELEPERLRGLDAGVEWRSGAVALDATVFWNEIEDAIVNVTLAEGPGTFPVAGFVPAGGVLRQRMNAGTIRALGLEAEAVWRRGPVELRGAVALTDAEVDGGRGAPQLTGLRPAQAPEISGLISAAWTVSERLRVEGRLRWEGERFEDDLNSRVLERAATVDLRGEWRLSDRALAWIAAENLLDADVEVSETADGVAGLGPPRSLRVGLRLSL